MNRKISEQGSIFLYILAALALLAALIVSITGGPQKSGTTVRLDALANGIYADVNTMAATVNECVLNYSTPVDVNGDGTADYPNPPFPIYDVAGTKGGSAGAGVTLDWSTSNLVCPGAAPTDVNNMPLLFTPKNVGNLKYLNDTATYSVHYRTNSTEGALLRVTRASADSLWEEAAARVSARYSACKAFYVKNGAVDGGACTNGCLYFWLVRLPASTIGTTDDSGATCP